MATRVTISKKVDLLLEKVERLEKEVAALRASVPAYVPYVPYVSPAADHSEWYKVVWAQYPWIQCTSNDQPVDNDITTA